MSTRSIHELLSLEGYETLLLIERWQLIDQIEQHIDKLQRVWLDQVKPGGIAYEQILTQIKQLRLKRFQIWNTFYPKFSRRIQLAA